jgi:hypothetical protein
VVSDRLIASLSLRVGDSVFTFPGGSVRAFSADVTRIGFEASVTLAISSEQEPDPLFAVFMTPAPMHARLTVEPKEPCPDGSGRSPLVLDGLVVDKALTETASASLASNPVIIRRYTLHFCDGARALWRQHFPTELYADATLKTLLEAHRPDGLKLSYDWPFLLEERAVIALGLGAPHNRASFYDWVLWLVDQHGGTFEYDTSASTYRFGSKKTHDTQPTRVLAADIAQYDVQLPPVPRAELHVLNSFTVSPVNRSVELASVIAGVRDDKLVHTPIPSRVDAMVDLAKAARRAPDYRVRVTFSQYPRSTFYPGKGALFDADMSGSLFVANKPLRVTSLRVDAREPALPEERAELEDDDASYDLEASAVLEPRGDAALDLPPYVPPAYPFALEGQVMSDGGQPAARTWSVLEDGKNSLLYHRVQVPLFNKKIIVRYDAGFVPGTFFFPAYKNQRVVLWMHFDEAEFARFVDWADNAKQPMDNQGQAIAFGKQVSDGTTLSHVYEDGKPVFSLARKQDTDYETVVISDGSLLISVGQTTLVPSIEAVYDLTANVAGAKGKLETAVKGSVSEVTGKFGGAAAKVQGALAQTAEDVESKLVEVEGSVAARVAVVRAEAESLIAALSDTAAEVSAAVAEAQGRIRALVGL